MIGLDDLMSRAICLKLSDLVRERLPAESLLLRRVALENAARAEISGASRTRQHLNRKRSSQTAPPLS